MAMDVACVSAGVSPPLPSLSGSIRVDQPCIRFFKISCFRLGWYQALQLRRSWSCDTMSMIAVRRIAMSNTSMCMLKTRAATPSRSRLRGASIRALTTSASSEAAPSDNSKIRMLYDGMLSERACFIFQVDNVYIHIYYRFVFLCIFLATTCFLVWGHLLLVQKPIWFRALTGDCPLCMREVDMLRKRNETYNSIEFVDIADKSYSADQNAGISYETAMKEIHAIDSDGKVITGTFFLRGG